MLKLETRADLQSLVDDGVEESLTLDYKASLALVRSNDAINELCKDVSALANSTGGQIVYGIEENKVTHKPERVDDGISDPKITREWIVQILNSRVHPRMNGVTVQRIVLSDRPQAFGFVVSIEPTQIGPHQAPDHRYYKRFELHSVPMEDYEVRDVMRRSTTPDLYLKLRLRSGSTQALRFTSGDAKSDPIPLVFSIGNRSSQPATHVIVTIGLDSRLTISSTGDYQGPLRQTGTDQLTRLRLLIRPPEWLPIFKEAQEDELSHRELHVRIAADDSIPKDFLITGTLQSPGFTSEQKWKLTDNEQSVDLSEIV
jgi:Putative DNA-binding domain